MTQKRNQKQTKKQAQKQIQTQTPKQIQTPTPKRIQQPAPAVPPEPSREKVLFAASEGAPFFKTGGLGDVAYALPKALAKHGVDIRVVLPYYSKLMPAEYQRQLQFLGSMTVKVGWQDKYCGILTMKLGDVQYYFIDNLQYFGRDGLYGYWDDAERFGFFDLAVLQMLQFVKFIPNVLHVNDWQTAFIPVLLHDKFSWIEPLRNIRTVLTIHNIEFQGQYDAVILDSVFAMGRQYFNAMGFNQNGGVNMLMGGINFADRVNTVSPSYAEEIKTPAFGHGLDGVLRWNAWKLSGILNGIDTELYDPETDPHLAAHYSAKDLAGKKKDKAALQKEVGLPQTNEPLFVMVSRLTRQKGADLLVDVVDRFQLEHNCQFIILGTGDYDLEEAFKRVAYRYPGAFSAQIRFDSHLAQTMYAGGDFFLMPSATEPSGLAQMMAMRYGTIPIVHATGGLRDSVQPFNEFTGQGNGFSFNDYRADVLEDMMKYAYDVYVNKPKSYAQLQQNAMAENFSWANASQAYIDLYTGLLTQK